MISKIKEECKIIKNIFFQKVKDKIWLRMLPFEKIQISLKLSFIQINLHYIYTGIDIRNRVLLTPEFCLRENCIEIYGLWFMFELLLSRAPLSYRPIRRKASFDFPVFQTRSKWRGEWNFSVSYFLEENDERTWSLLKARHKGNGRKQIIQLLSIIFVLECDISGM